MHAASKKLKESSFPPGTGKNAHEYVRTVYIQQLKRNSVFLRQHGLNLGALSERSQS